mgnify:CR=1 FL=1
MIYPKPLRTSARRFCRWGGEDLVRERSRIQCGCRQDSCALFRQPHRLAIQYNCPSNSVTFRWHFKPHSLSVAYLSLAAMSVKADLPSGKVLVTRIRLQASRFSCSIALLVRIHRQVLRKGRLPQGLGESLSDDSDDLLESHPLKFSDFASSRPFGMFFDRFPDQLA